MKKLSFNYFIAVFIVFSITVLGGSYGMEQETVQTNCTKLNEKCLVNEDCCSKFCKPPFFKMFSGHCEWNETAMDSFESSFQANSIKCSFHNQSDETEQEMKKKFDINGAYAKLPPYTITEVSINGKKTIVTINDLKPKSSDDVLELSEAAARELGITNEGDVDCDIIIPVLDQYINYIKMGLYFVPFLILIAGLWYLTLPIPLA